ncbi:hypothetical protein CHLNCDRAFT_143308 [Chlorella variabilis]|uniref:D-isomer specific 2-hydroxyacid dehydrogenase NAD-binding domain-containing protein n=1 Tax=Chlorella variabilis TaxID=554065 RepID=E1Z9X8_CHLVA|nr:hypothetical protein CHLNCDRAFT_143308 [Chlorella variabilis]EFN57851.1 hypothetical protein CHLNCDRAFT_143308 [Chlorella variabilis]|eukprot:XP_005849953.1 hypothetical protein CHLNCDRAFT_143308 [Chlorella variabilis]
MHFGFQFTKEALQHEPGVEVVQCDRSQLAHELMGADVAVPLMARLDAQLLRSARRLKLIIQYGVGVEGIDMPSATELGIWVSNIPSAGTGNAASCAEHAIYLMLATLRYHNAMADSIRERRLGVPLGQTLLGKTVLLVGFGNIAKELAVRLKPFGVRATALRRRPWGSSKPAAPLPQQDGEGAPWAADGSQQQPAQQQQGSELEAAAEADEHNRGMIGAEFLSHCKPGVRIVNVARGGLLDYEAVRQGLSSGRITGLGLDVQEQEPVDPQHWLAQHPSVILTPHIAGVTEMSYRSMAEVVAAAVLRLRHGQAPRRRLNDPAHPRALDWLT